MVTQAKIDIATREGLRNADALARACERLGLGYAAACTKVDMESNGDNIYGHDVGGALSTRNGAVTVCGKTYPRMSNIPVTHQNFAVFLMMMAAGHKSNGVGPSQITYAGELPDGRTGGYFRMAADDENLDLVLPEDNFYFGLKRLKEHYDNVGNWAQAATLYNAGNLRNGVNSYGRMFVVLHRRWRITLREG